VSLKHFSIVIIWGGLVKWTQYYEVTFEKLSLLGQKTWNVDEIKKRWLVKNAQNTGLFNTVLKNSQ
jgi:cell division septal protein FtsQ